MLLSFCAFAVLIACFFYFLAVECLIEHGANLLATDHSNTLPVDLCQYADMQAYLKGTLAVWLC